MTEENQNIEEAWDYDVPVDEKLLMGEDEQPDDDTEVDIDALTKIAGEEDEPLAEEKPEDDQRAVPQVRFNQVYAENKALKERLAELENESTAEVKRAEQVDIKALRREANEALIEGDMDKLEAAQDKIDAELLRQAEINAESRMTQRQELESFQRKAAELMTEYSVLNSETGNPDAISMVVELRDAYIAKGMRMTQALETAAKKVAPLFSSKEAKSAETTETVPDQRKLEAVKRGAETSNRIPAQGGGVGNRSLPVKGEENYSQKEWDNLPQAERDRILAA